MLIKWSKNLPGEHVENDEIGRNAKDGDERDDEAQRNVERPRDAIQQFQLFLRPERFQQRRRRRRRRRCRRAIHIPHQ